jgi:hypothetical protein
MHRDAIAYAKHVSDGCDEITFDEYINTPAEQLAARLMQVWV